MSKAYKQRSWDKRAAKQDKAYEARQAAKKVRRDYKGWVKLITQAICGCCAAELWYKDRASAEAAARKAAFRHMKLTDDRGDSETVDGFYGFSFVEI